MAGVKGRSGGPRPNSGGARPGAGRKPRKTDDDGETPLALLMAFARNKDLAVSDRIRAAGLAAQYVHAKRGEGGKKETAKTASESAAAGKFAPALAPKLVVNNR